KLKLAKQVSSGWRTNEVSFADTMRRKLIECPNSAEVAHPSSHNLAHSLKTYKDKLESMDAELRSVRTQLENAKSQILALEEAPARAGAVGCPGENNFNMSSSASSSIDADHMEGIQNEGAERDPPEGPHDIAFNQGFASTGVHLEKSSSERPYKTPPRNQALPSFTLPTPPDMTSFFEVPQRPSTTPGRQPVSSNSAKTPFKNSKECKISQYIGMEKREAQRLGTGKKGSIWAPRGHSSVDYERDGGSTVESSKRMSTKFKAPSVTPGLSSGPNRVTPPIFQKNSQRVFHRNSGSSTTPSRSSSPIAGPSSLPTHSKRSFKTSMTSMSSSEHSESTPRFSLPSSGFTLFIPEETNSDHIVYDHRR
ncbi:hypothetical protein H0H93_008291, partial [Arthromyces matolae]